MPPLYWPSWDSAFLESQASAYTPATHAELQAVVDDPLALGTSLWASIHSTETPYPISMVGVVINNPADMLNYTTAGTESAWQTFFQALPAGTYGSGAGTISVASGDFGGSAMYMVHSFTYGTPAIYSDETWLSEMERLNNCSGTTTGEPLRYGDVVLVTANAPGLFYNGKFNINGTT